MRVNKHGDNNQNNTSETGRYDSAYNVVFLRVVIGIMNDNLHLSIPSSVYDLVMTSKWMTQCIMGHCKFVANVLNGIFYSQLYTQLVA